MAWIYKSVTTGSNSMREKTKLKGDILMKVSNTIELPFSFNIGGTGKHPVKSSIWSRIFSSSFVTKEDETAESNTAVEFEGNIHCVTQCDMSVEEMKELFFENKEANAKSLKQLLDGTYRKAAKEAGTVVTEYFSSLLTSVADAAPSIMKKYEKVHSAYLETKKTVDEQTVESEALDLSNETVVQGIKNEIREDLKEGYTWKHESMENIAAGKEGKYGERCSTEYAKAYLKFEEEILKEINSSDEK